MVARVLLGAAVSALALMLWGFLFWVVLSAPGGTVQPLPDEVPLMESLHQSIPRSGTYVFPTPPRPESGLEELPALEAYRLRHIAGPVGLLYFNREGTDPLSAGTYVLGLAHFFVASLLAALLLVLALPVLAGYVARALYVFGLGVFATVSMRLFDPIWWHLPWGHFLHSAVYHAASWLVAGIVLAGIVKPHRGAVHLTDPSKPLWKRALDVD